MDSPTPDTFRDVIALWPSRVMFAEAIGIKAVNGHMMWRRDAINPRHFDAIVKAANDIGQSHVTKNLLISIAAKLARSRAAARARQAAVRAKRQRRKAA